TLSPRAELTSSKLAGLFFLADRLSAVDQILSPVVPAFGRLTPFCSTRSTFAAFSFGALGAFGSLAAFGAAGALAAFLAGALGAEFFWAAAMSVSVVSVVVVFARDARVGIVASPERAFHGEAEFCPTLRMGGGSALVKCIQCGHSCRDLLRFGCTCQALSSS